MRTVKSQKRDRVYGWCVGACLVALGLGCVIDNSEELEPLEIQCIAGESDRQCSGGETTVFDASPLAFNSAVANLDDDDIDKFELGQHVFTVSFQAGNGFGGDFKGVGPRFNDSSCGGCHLGNGRANPYDNRGQPTPALLVRVSKLDAQGVAHPLDAYGSQLQPQGVSDRFEDIGGEVDIFVRWETTTGAFDDGTPYELVRPDFSFSNPAHGRFEQGFVYSPRATSSMIGLGLLEAIPSSQILAQADPDDEDQDGISGRPNIHRDEVTGARKVGRFGWKSSHATLQDQNAAAMLGDIGVVSRHVRTKDCNVAMPSSPCTDVNGVLQGEVEIEDHFMDALDFYTRHIAPPASRFGHFEEGGLHQEGLELFEELGCDACHTPSWTTASGHPNKALAGQVIFPYTDLLLHDMGEGLADGRPDGEANGHEWRTAPLWGLGLVDTVNDHQRFLHDGRARNVSEAILWHGGEAAASRDLYKALDSSERRKLIAFLNAL